MPVPQKETLFNSYQSTSINYLNAMGGGITNAQRLGLTAPEKALWENYALTQWPPVWAKIISPDTKTTTAVNEKDKLKRIITLFQNNLLYRMASSTNVTPTDKDVLLLPSLVRVKKDRPDITTAPNTSMSPMEGAKILSSNRVDNKSKRDSMHPDADALQMVFTIGGPAPVTPQACTGNFISTKAKFIFDGGMENDGKKLFAYTRWVNLREPSKNGPWGTLVMATISAGTPVTTEVVV